jgi:hypothetical protein
MSGEGKYSRKQIIRIWVVFLAVIGILILGDLNRRMSDARRLERDAALLETEVAALEAEGVHLETQVAEASGEGVAERWARGQAKLRREGEVLIVPIPVGGYVEPPLPTPTPVPEPPSRLDVWWLLLFGE